MKKGKAAGIVILVVCLIAGILVLLMGMKVIPSLSELRQAKVANAQVEKQVVDTTPVVNTSKPVQEPKSNLNVKFFSSVESAQEQEAIGTVVSKSYGLCQGDYGFVQAYLFIELPNVGVVPYSVGSNVYDALSVGAKVQVSYVMLKGSDSVYPMINSASLI